MYEFPHDLSNDLENKEILDKIVKLKAHIY